MQAQMMTRRSAVGDWSSSKILNGEALLAAQLSAHLGLCHGELFACSNRPKLYLSTSASMSAGSCGSQQPLPRADQGGLPRLQLHGGRVAVGMGAKAAGTPALPAALYVCCSIQAIINLT